MPFVLHLRSDWTAKIGYHAVISCALHIPHRHTDPLQQQIQQQVPVLGTWLTSTTICLLVLVLFSLQELALMFSFNHKNILRGFHYITYVSSCCSIAEDSEHSSSKAGAARPNSGQQKQQQQQRSSCNGSGTSPQDTPELVADAPAHDIGGKQLITAADNHHQHHLQQQEQQPGWYGSNRSDGSAYSTRIRSTHCSAQRAETHLVLELCDCTLSEYMRHLQPVPLSEEVLLQLLALLQDVAQGLAVLHAVNVVHADLVSLDVFAVCKFRPPLLHLTDQLDCLHAFLDGLAYVMCLHTHLH